jgi:LmbE family N-acetylglucosaminyl deacetylase
LRIVPVASHCGSFNETNYPPRRLFHMHRLADGPAIFIQPHYDDVALSCGGTVAMAADAGHRPLILTLFGSEIVDEMVGAFAEWKHSRWKLDDVDAVVATRREEDSEAAAILGADVRWLGLPDAIYRADRYTSDSQLFGSLVPEEIELASHLVEEVMTLPEWRDGTRVFVPLGAGNHVDHQLAFELGRGLAKRGIEVLAYEDCPYAIHTPQGLARRLGNVRKIVGAADAVPVGKHLDRRIDAIAAYRSQTPVIFRFTDDFAGAIRDFAHGGGAPVERFRRVLG